MTPKEAFDKAVDKTRTKRKHQKQIEEIKKEMETKELFKYLEIDHISNK